MKICVTCQDTKSLSEFYKRKDSPDGYRNDCKDCRKARSLKNFYADPDVKRAKNMEAYWKRKEQNPDLWKPIYAKFREKYLAVSRVYYSKHADKIKARQRLWSKQNRGAANALGKKYKLKKRNATPNWLTNEQVEHMQCLYKVAAMYTAEGLDIWHVDHIVPIRGKDVCGLHVPWNLRIITASENLRKGNKFSMGTRA